MMEKENQGFIYLDHNATTPLAPEAIKEMVPLMEKGFGNPSSSYFLGEQAKQGVEKARKEVASLLGCETYDVIFTSGGTETNNLVLKGLFDYKHPETYHLITSTVEHPAILNPALFLMDLGADVTFLTVDSYGQVQPEEVRKAVRSETTLISIMLANNETGTLQPIKEIAKIARQFDIMLHTDAAQALGKMDVDVHELGVDFLTVAGHKLYGPKGVGALFIRQGRELVPLIHGAAQERGIRPGTENTILCAGLGAACLAAGGRLKSDIQHMETLRNHLQALLFDGIDDLVMNGHPNERLPNTLNVSVPRLEGAKILEGIPHIMASTGAACHDRDVTLSHVLSAMGVSPDIGMGALRLTVGRGNTEEDIEIAARAIIERVNEMRHE
jgi:cysteine desulfurase